MKDTGNVASHVSLVLIFFIFGMLSDQYAVHLFGYLKKWRENPQWSFSCCLALILPLVDLPGEISGLIGTNVLDTQLETGQMEMSTIGGVVKDVTLKEDEQAGKNPAGVQKDKFTDTQLETGGKETSTIPGTANRFHGASGPTLANCIDDDYSNHIQGDDCYDDQLENGEVEKPVILGTTKTFHGAVHATLEDSVSYGNSNEVQEDIDKNSHQGTQKALSAISSLSDVVVYKPKEETDF